MAKKIKKIRRIKKKPIASRFRFDDDSQNYSFKSNYKKVFYLFILIAAYLMAHFGIINPTVMKAQLYELDLNTKKSAIETGKQIQSDLTVKKKNINSEFVYLKQSFFRVEQSEDFFKLLSNKALDSRLTIVAINKISEENYKEPKKDKPDEFDVYENYTQVTYEIKYTGTFPDYLKFIEKIQNEDKSLITNNAVIEKADNGKIHISTNLTLNFINL